MSDDANIHPAIQPTQLQRLYQVSKVIHSALDQQEALGLIVREAVGLVGATTGSVVLINPTDSLLEIQAAHGLPEGSSQLRLRVGEGITGWVAQHGKPALVPDVREDARYVQIHDHTRSELAVPLEVNGSIRGVINVDSDQLNTFSLTDQTLLTELASQAATVIHNAFLYERSRIRANLFESLITVGQAINSAVDLDDALTAITREGCSLMNARTSALQLLDESGDRLALVASHGAEETYLNKPDVVVSDSFLGSVVRRQKPMQIENIQTSNVYQQQNMARKEGLVALLSVPLVFGGSAIGTLNIYKADAYVFSNDEIQIAMALAELSAIAIEKARLLERIVESEEHLRQNEKLSALGLLAGEVAHEIRNPLGGIASFANLLERDLETDDPSRRLVRKITEGVARLNRIVSSLLSYTRPLNLNTHPVDLMQTVEEAAAFFEIDLERKQQAVEIRRLFLETPCVCQVDTEQFHQVILNLLLNATQAMPEGGTIELEVAQTSDADGDWIVTRVRDTGMGIDEELQEKLFTPFFTTKEDGTGLGLVTSRKIIEAHGGNIVVDSTPGDGTCFTIALPL